MLAGPYVISLGGEILGWLYFPTSCTTRPLTRYAPVPISTGSEVSYRLLNESKESL